MRKTNASNIDIIITGNVAWQDNLAWKDKLLYGVIRGLTRNDYYCCYATNEYLSELMGRDSSSIRRTLNTLEKMGYIFRSKGWVLLDNGKLCYQHRMIVLVEHRNKFENMQEKMSDIRAISGKKSSLRVCKNAHVEVCKNAHINNNIYSYEENIINNNIKREITPMPPLQGEQKVTLSKPEGTTTFGKYENVFMTKVEHEELVREFGEKLVSSLIEELSAMIQSNLRRLRKKVIHSAIIRAWAIRRTSPANARVKRVLCGQIDMHRRSYTDEELANLLTPLTDEDAE